MVEPNKEEVEEIREVQAIREEPQELLPQSQVILVEDKTTTEIQVMYIYIYGYNYLLNQKCSFFIFDII